MENDKNKAGRIERTMKDARAYATLLTEKVCLSLIENLSLLSNSLFVVALVGVLLSIAALFFAVALTWALGIAIGSVFYAVLLMGGLFALSAVVVYMLRRRLLVGPAVRMFSRIMYDMFHKYSDDE